MEKTNNEFKSIDLKSIRKQLPHGAISEIAKRTGVLPPTVSRALAGDQRSPKLPMILKVTAEYLAEYKTSEKEAILAIHQLTNK